MGFIWTFMECLEYANLFRQEIKYWLSPNPGIKPSSPSLQADSLPSEPPGKCKYVKSHWVVHFELCSVQTSMRETQVQSLGWEDPLEKEMAIHSSTLVWKIPWTEKHGRLQFMGSQRVGHNWATSLTQGCYRKIKKVISEEKNPKLVIQKKIHVFLKKLKLNYFCDCEITEVTGPFVPNHFLGLWSLHAWFTAVIRFMCNRIYLGRTSSKSCPSNLFPCPCHFWKQGHLAILLPDGSF